MKASIEELKLRCLIALKELRLRGNKVKMDVNSMSRQELTGAWGFLCKEIDANN